MTRRLAVLVRDTRHYSVRTKSGRNGDPYVQ